MTGKCEILWIFEASGSQRSPCWDHTKPILIWRIHLFRTFLEHRRWLKKEGQVLLCTRYFRNFHHKWTYSAQSFQWNKSKHCDDPGDHGGKWRCWKKCSYTSGRISIIITLQVALLLSLLLSHNMKHFSWYVKDIDFSLSDLRMGWVWNWNEVPGDGFSGVRCGRKDTFNWF